MIAITFALPAESRDLAARLRRTDVTVFHTGVGRGHCEQKIDKFLHSRKPKLLISSGFAGAVRNDLNVGDVIAAENFSDRQLLLRAEQECRARVVKLATAESIVDSLEQRNEIARASGADAVDMETETIAQACARHGVPLLSLRVISDSPGQPFPAPPRVLFDVERQQTDLGKLAFYLLAHPFAAVRLLRFSRQIKKARKVLTKAIIDLVRAL